ncbi:MAG: minichromosome maintenance protein MCM [Thermoplasmata archaeon]|nr:MAG: minichromosome maintenance protein MCM [Thermoplasmata archaeon]
MVSLWEQFFVSKDFNTRILDAVNEYPETKSIEVKYFEIDYFNPDLANHLLEKPNKTLPAAEQALVNQMPTDAIHKGVKLNLRVVELPRDTYRIPIRDLRAEHLGKMIAIEGLVRKATEVRPKITEAFFECLRCQSRLRVPQDEFTFKEPMECSRDDPNIYINRPGCGRAASSTAFKLLLEMSTFIDTQKLEIQESPEGLRGGDQPQRLTVYVEDDLTGQISPGDRVIISGMLRSRQKQMRPQSKSTFFDIHLDGISIELEQKEFEEVEITEEDLEQILEFSRDPNIYSKMRDSIAPSIYGLSTEKESLLLQLFGGIEKKMPDETKIRGDIHILFVGDPGTAKSQLLEYMSRLSPRGVYASGKSSTAAGLTAAAVRDEFGEGRWTLEAGALVLADKGLACVDEIDKMSPQDRSSMHEAMEQQIIHVAKAGITAALQSRCAVLAAANPKYGRFDETSPIAMQINMPTTLLSRFDVIFTITDKPEERRDSDMADHILHAHLGGEIHQFREKIEEETYSEKEEEAALEGIHPELSRDFLRKYVAYAKRHSFPVMTNDAIESIKDYYIKLRSQDTGGEEGSAIAITPRQLEAFVRLSEASARVRLSNKVTMEDTERAIRIVEYFLRKVASDAGVFDIDMIATGTSHSQRSRLMELMNIIEELVARSKNDTTNLDEVLMEAESHGINRDLAKNDIDKLKKEGRIYYPKMEAKKGIKLV